MSLATKSTKKKKDCTPLLLEKHHRIYSAERGSQHLFPNSANILGEISLKTALPLSSHITFYNFVKSESGFQYFKIEFVVNFWKECLLNYLVKNRLKFSVATRQLLIFLSYLFVCWLTYVLHKVATCILKSVADKLDGFLVNKSSHLHSESFVPETTLQKRKKHK